MITFVHSLQDADSLGIDASCWQPAGGADFESADGRAGWCGWRCTGRSARLPAAMRLLRSVQG